MIADYLGEALHTDDSAQAVDDAAAFLHAIRAALPSIRTDGMSDAGDAPIPD